MKALYALAVLYIIATNSQVWAEGTPTAAVITQPLVMHDMTQTLTGFGTVVGQPGHVFNLSLPASRLVDELLVSVGQAVQKGQPLLRISADATARLAFSQAANALTFAQRDLTRQQALLAQQLATNAQVDTAQHAVRDAEQALATQRALGSGEAVSVLRAPVSGVVTSLVVATGDRFAASATLGQVAASNAMQVRLGLLPEESRRVLPGMKVRVSAVLDTTQTAAGVVDVVASQIDPTTQRVDVVVHLNTALLPGTRVKGVVVLRQRKTVAVLRQAVLRDEQGSYLFQLVNGQARRVAVSTGEESNGLIAVSGALVTSSPVVVTGNYELEDGMRVREAVR